MSGSLQIIQVGSFYELRDQANELLQTSTDAGILANAALALYPNGGCSLVFGPGTFNCSQITINQSNTSIVGSGWSTIIQPIGNNSVFFLSSPSGNGIFFIRLGNFECRDSGLMSGTSAFFYFNAVVGLSYIVVNAEFSDIIFSGTLNRAFYDGGGTGNYLTGQVQSIKFLNISSDDSSPFANTFFSIMNLRTAIFSQGLISLALPNNSSVFALGVGTNSTISCSTTFEDLQIYVNGTGYSGTAVVLNNVNAVHFNDVQILFTAPPNTTSTGLSISGSLGEMVFQRLKVYSANVGGLFTSSSDIGFTCRTAQCS